jgi:phosphoribosylaminoimidazole-succinocarboxamide synthase
MAQQLPEAIFTPATKAEAGDHDENISYAAVEKLVGADLAKTVKDTTLRLYREAAAFARVRGIIIADTKFEFGRDEEGRLHLIDEVLTPDSSRFWPADATSRASARPASTSSSSATTWKPWTGTRRRPAPGCRRTSSRRRPPITAKP